jgi:hypothetical protein
MKPYKRLFEDYSSSQVRDGNKTIYELYFDNMKQAIEVDKLLKKSNIEHRLLKSSSGYHDVEATIVFQLHRSYVKAMRLLDNTYGE